MLAWHTEKCFYCNKVNKIVISHKIYPFLQHVLLHFNCKMNSLKTAKVYFSLAVLLLVAKPFLGFSFFSRLHPPTGGNIFVKAFTKRKQEYTKDSEYDILSIQKKISNPDIGIFLRFSFLLSILFPLIFSSSKGASITYQHQLIKGPAYFRHSYLLNSQFIIWFSGILLLFVVNNVQ